MELEVYVQIYSTNILIFNSYSLLKYFSSKTYGEFKVTLQFCDIFPLESIGHFIFKRLQSPGPWK